jgi:hypothetical protein
MRDKMSYIYPKNNQKIIESMYRVDPIEQKRLNHLRSLGIPVPREPPPLSTNNNFKTGIKWKKNEILDIFKPYLI